MQRLVVSLIGLLLLFSSCHRNSWSKEVKGFKAYPKKEFWYKWFGNNKNAPKPQPGEEVEIHYTLQKGDLVLDQSYTNSKPVLVHIPEKQYDNFFTKALKLMAQGDSLHILIPAKNVPELLGGYAQEFDSEDLVTFTYKMMHIKDKATLDNEMQETQQKLDSIRQKIPALISAFRDKKLSDVQTTASGLSYLIFNQGKGLKAAYNDVASMHYICFSEEGKIIDDSYINMVPLVFPIGTNALIDGCSEGVSLLNQGGSALLFIPPNLAYGAQGNEVIPPNSLVIFYIELFDLQKE